MASRWGARADALERASEHARLAGAAREQALATGALALCFYWGPTPVGEAIRRCEEELPRASSDQVLEARLLAVLAGLHAMRGSFAEARELYARSKGLLEELGQQLQMAVHTLVRGVAELLADDPVAAERELRWGCDTLEQMSERAGLPTLRAVLAEALLQQGRLGEAEELVELSERESAPRDIAAQVQWRGMRAKLLARRGDGERAEPLALEAVALAEKTDALNLHAEALGSLAEVLATIGERTRAEAALLESADLYAAKENAVSKARTRAMLESLRAAPAERSSPTLDRDASPE
jgi:tetratricopeptide (TPR) repeat protein